MTVSAPGAARLGRPGAAPSGVGGGPVLHRQRSWRRESWWFLAFALPNFIFIAVFAYWPVIYNAYLSLQDWNMISPDMEFVGLANYADVLGSADFRWALVRTVILTGGVTILALVLGLAVAMLLGTRFIGRNLTRTVVFAPYVVGSAAVGTIWLFVFDPNFGLFRALLAPFGLTSPNWMDDSAWALPGLMMVEVWRYTGFVAIIYIGALTGIPKDLIEAAVIDGANGWKRFRSVTLPLLMPITYFLAIIMVTTVFRGYDLIAVMTGGGPAGATTTLGWYIYQQGFDYNNAGAAGVGGIVMFIVLLGITGIQSRLMRKGVNYET